MAHAKGWIQPSWGTLDHTQSNDTYTVFRGSNGKTYAVAFNFNSPNKDGSAPGVVNTAGPNGQWQPYATYNPNVPPWQGPNYNAPAPAVHHVLTELLRAQTRKR